MPRPALAGNSNTLLGSSQGCLPFDPLELLSARSPRLAHLVESISRRRDVRALRARLLSLLLELRCPLRGRPRRSWYVPGAVARLGLEALRRAWRSFYGVEPPCVRTLRAHLGVLERVFAIVRQPGELVAVSLQDLGREEGGEPWLPRHADTLHVLDEERAAAWWQTIGRPIVLKAPRARIDPRAWRRTVGDWRQRMKEGTQLDLFAAPARGGFREGVPDRPGLPIEQAEAAAAKISRARHEPLALLCALRDAGAEIRGRASFTLAGEPMRLAGAAALLARALVRGDVVRRPAAWVVRAFRYVSREELRTASAWLARQGYDPPGRPVGWVKSR